MDIYRQGHFHLARSFHKFTADENAAIETLMMIALAYLDFDRGQAGDLNLDLENIGLNQFFRLRRKRNTDTAFGNILDVGRAPFRGTVNGQHLDGKGVGGGSTRVLSSLQKLDSLGHGDKEILGNCVLETNKACPAFEQAAVKWKGYVEPYIGLEKSAHLRRNR